MPLGCVGGTHWRRTSRVAKSESRNRAAQPQPPAAGARPALVPRKLSRLHQPEGMSLEAWQRALRRQFGREQRFTLKNTGGHPIFSEFEVTNPESRNTYRVVIRGSEPGNNFCACPDFATNTLGTCKHLEFTLARLGRTRANRQALARGFARPSARSICTTEPGARCDSARAPRRRPR